MFGFPLDTYVGSDLGYLEGSTYGDVDIKFDNLLDNWMDLI